MTKRFALIGCALLLVASVSCNRNEEDPQGAEPTDEVTESATPAPTPCTLDGASEDAVDKRNSEAPISPVTDVRYAKDGCPRIVFEFKDQVPGYSVAYAEPPFSECGSGEEVATDGWGSDAFIEVKLEPSASVDLMAEAEPTYTGPRDIDVGGEVLKHMKVVCDFEAHFDWIVGLDRSHPFQVVTFDEPPRLVIGINQA